MERLRGAPVHPRIRISMENWLESIKKVQTRRKEELINSTSRHPMYFMADDKGIMFCSCPTSHFGFKNSH